MGEPARGLELLALVLGHPSSWQWAKDRAALLVPDIEGRLSPDEAAHARARGPQLKLRACMEGLLPELAMQA